MMPIKNELFHTINSKQKDTRIFQPNLKDHEHYQNIVLRSNEP